MQDAEYSILEDRLSRTRKVMIFAVGAALCALVALGVLIPPSTGIVGVHVSWHVPAHRLENADLSYIWSGMGWIHLLLVALLQVAGAIASLAFVWALVARKSRIAIWLLALTMLINLFAPFSQIIQPSPPKAMDAKQAAVFVSNSNNFLPKDPVSQRYMQAQLAYILGDKVRAKKLSAGLTAQDLASPNEARYRLQFLQGRPLEISNICRRTGCFKLHTIETGRLVAAATFLLALLVALAALYLFTLFKRRLDRIGELQAKTRLRTMLA